MNRNCTGGDSDRNTDGVWFVELIMFEHVQESSLL